MKPGQQVELLITEEHGWLRVWADEDMKNTILSVPGVSNVFTNMGATQYNVVVDQRFDMTQVRKNIETAILTVIGEPDYDR